MTARKKISRRTNIQFVNDMMNYSNYGALKQAFILEAIREYANKHVLNEDAWDNGFVDATTWKGIAEEICEEYIEHYNPGLAYP